MMTILPNIVIKFLLKTIGIVLPTDLFARRFPISVKGVILYHDKVLLLRNERNEWDLPGGKLRDDLSIAECLAREVKEETNLEIVVGNVLDPFLLKILNWVRVVIIVYQCELISDPKDLKISGEHFDGAFFSINELDEINVFEEYKTLIKKILDAK